MFIYPRWTIDSTVAWQWSFTLSALALLVVLFWWSSRSRGPFASALIFGGTLFPVLGFVNVFPFIFSYVADHFQYLASLPVFALVGAGGASLSSYLPPFIRIAGSVMALGFIGGLSRQQSTMYRDVFALYETTIARNPSCWMAHNNLAIALANLGRVDEAIPHVEEALKLDPTSAGARSDLGAALLQTGDVPRAIKELELAVKQAPNEAGHRVILGSSDFLTAEGLDVRGLAGLADNLRADGATVVHVGVDGQPAGLVAVADPVRPAGQDLDGQARRR